MYKLVLFTNSKSHMGSRLIQKLATLNDLERRMTADLRYAYNS